MDINQRLALRLRALRDARGLSLDALAERSRVGRSTISLTERGESSPTAAVLDKLSSALGVTLASLFEDAAPPEAPSPLSRAADQPVWIDPASGYVRRNLSPAARSPIQLVEVVFPPGGRVAYDTGPRDADIHQQVWMIDGTMNITVGDTPWRLETGDCLAMRLDSPIAFHNPTDQPARYLVALSILPIAAARRTA
ncbi:helix-turn-helix domain-containing protein [Ralstonia solanacearum]|uniref:helix-turn-helix domain-containing protein n=1 Tax=Ralstonia solanacearum TaxID=305 RepID=UPI00078C94FE|nr:helix-turn-helix domain-containing protein [Ralstonia solanacearum]AMP38813.1 DNA-binding protein [Ralstonia solanacearum]AXV87640.1 helix-turn-helix domain-containing protein [Ralstonia solanacearum]AXW07105.1 helix-turn-helix domain-containing protein [Ralstonia solanacearum]AXW24882.1 helix-turn-helix domain-containing protein [Ralstonia solanacearum]AXW81798.1 helix-turn-helix domain-containing protein [Ralstonia solanacearum]